MKAAPMSRKVTQVTSHSPSHSSVGLRFVVGWPCSAISGFGSRPSPCLSIASSTASMP